MVQYHWDMWAKHSEILAPLTDLVGECGKTKTLKKNKTKKNPWQWDPIHQQAFGSITAAITKEVILAYLDFSKLFEIYTDASAMHLGVVIAQDNRSITFFSRSYPKHSKNIALTKLNSSIVETLKEFKGMLWGQSIKVFTDHKNLTRDALGLTSGRVYQWRLLLEEYAPKIIYVKGIHNTVADAILRLKYNPKLNSTNEYTHAMLGVPSEEMNARQWKLVMHHWQSYNESNTSTQVHYEQSVCKLQ
jgi:hypothetical protein